MEAVVAEGLVVLMVVAGEYEVVLLRVNHCCLERAVTEGFDAVGVDTVITGFHDFAITLVGSLTVLEEDDVVLTSGVTNMHGVTDGGAVDVVDCVSLGGEFLTSDERSDTRSDSVLNHFLDSLLNDGVCFG